MSRIDVEALQAAARRERSAFVHALVARFAAWLRSAPTIRARTMTRRECLGTGC
ncbi:MAG: hypothetical protein AB7K53_04010 [Burkholderiales bacterium]